MGDLGRGAPFLVLGLKRSGRYGVYILVTIMRGLPLLFVLRREE